MSCVITIRKDENSFIMIADSQSSTDTAYFNVDNALDGKMLRVLDDNKAIIAHTGDSANISIIKHIEHLTNDFSEKYPVFDYKYCARVLMPKVRKTFADLHLIEDATTEKFQTLLMVARDNKAFALFESGALIEIESWYTVGSGSLGALGVLSTADHIKDPLIKGLLGIDAAIQYDNYCSYPITVASTDSDKIHILSKKDVQDILNKKKEFTL